MTELAGYIQEVAERASGRGDDEREWFEGWLAEFTEATENMDDEASALLVDVLVAWDRWLSSRNPIPRRAVSGA